VAAYAALTATRWVSRTRLLKYPLFVGLGEYLSRFAVAPPSYSQCLPSWYAGQRFFQDYSCNPPGGRHEFFASRFLDDYRIGFARAQPRSPQRGGAKEPCRVCGDFSASRTRLVEASHHCLRA